MPFYKTTFREEHEDDELGDADFVRSRLALLKIEAESITETRPCEVLAIVKTEDAKRLFGLAGVTVRSSRVIYSYDQKNTGYSQVFIERTGTR